MYTQIHHHCTTSSASHSKTVVILAGQMCHSDRRQIAHTARAQCWQMAGQNMFYYSLDESPYASARRHTRRQLMWPRSPARSVFVDTDDTHGHITRHAEHSTRCSRRQWRHFTSSDTIHNSFPCSLGDCEQMDNTLVISRIVDAHAHRRTHQSAPTWPSSPRSSTRCWCSSSCCSSPPTNSATCTFD